MPHACNCFSHALLTPRQSAHLRDCVLLICHYTNPLSCVLCDCGVSREETEDTMQPSQTPSPQAEAGSQPWSWVFVRPWASSHKTCPAGYML